MKINVGVLQSNKGWSQEFTVGYTPTVQVPPQYKDTHILNWNVW